MSIVRAPETPLILWICAAVCAHFVFAEGGDQVATYHEDRSYLFQLGTRARSIAHGKDQTFDLLTNEDGSPKEAEPIPEPPKPEAKKDEKKAEPPPPETPKEQKKAPDQPKAPEVKVVAKEDDPLKKLDEIPLKQDNRIAVKQHAQKNQADNPNAKFIADEANKVEDETVATQTSHDQDDPNPTPGGSKTAGPRDKVGDSDRTKIAESDEHKGEKDRAPGEKGTEFDVQHEAKPIEKAQGPVAINQAQPSSQIPRAGGDGRDPSLVTPNQPPPQLAPGAPPTPSPEVMQGAQGGWAFNPIRPGAQADPSQGVPGTTNQKPPTLPNQPTKWLGLGGSPGPGQVNLNLTHTGVVAAVGVDQLRKEREADGERRKSEHRGSWTASNFERWRNAIENYVSSVKPGNQTALNTAAVPFASYLNTIHNRIHPIFADSFLGSLDNLPKSHPMNDPKIITRLEIVVSPKEGRIVKMGIVKTSGITAFDIAALDSVHRAHPFGPAPGALRSCTLDLLEPGPSQKSIGWAGSALLLTVGIAVLAKIAGVIILPGSRGIAGEAAINILDAASGALAYTLTALLVALVCAASFELARSRAVHVIARGAVVATSGLIVALASPAVVERLSALPSVVLAVIASLVALVAGAAVVRAPQTRAIGGVLVLLSICGLLRVVAWETSATAFERLSLPLHEVARGFSTVAVALQAIAALIAAAWIGTRSKWHGRILANLAILLAFGATWVAAQTSDAPSRVEAVLRTSLSGASGLPPPYLLGSIAAFLVPASILLTIAALVQPGQSPLLVAAIGLGLLSHGAFDVPLQALLVTTSAQWAMLAMADERSVTAPMTYPGRGLASASASAPPEGRPRTESA